jgi:hypothetical protein
MPAQEATRKILYTKNMYLLKLLLNVVTAGIETLVMSGNKFCTPVSKKTAVCELSHSSLLLKCCDPNQFFGQENRW